MPYPTHQRPSTLEEPRRAPPVQDPPTNLPLRAGPAVRATPGQPLRVPTLRVVSGPNMMQFILLLPEEEVILGREETGGLALLDASVSRRHAKAVHTGGRVVVSDLNSTNGTAISADPGVRGQPIQQAELAMGQWLEVGGVCLRLEALSLEQLAHLERMVARPMEPGRERSTGLLSPGWLDTELEGWLQGLAWRGEPVGGLMIELPPGTAEWQAGICRLLMWRARGSDICVRHSDGIVWIGLPGATAALATRVGERLAREVLTYRWPRAAGGSGGVRVHASEWARGEPGAAWVRRAWGALVMRGGRGGAQAG